MLNPYQNKKHPFFVLQIFQIIYNQFIYYVVIFVYKEMCLWFQKILKKQRIHIINDTEHINIKFLEKNISK